MLVTKTAFGRAVYGMRYSLRENPGNRSQHRGEILFLDCPKC